MKISEVVDQLQLIIPKYTDIFSSNLSISTIVSLNGVATITTTLDHKLSTGDAITISDVSYNNPIEEISKDGLIFSIKVNGKHDLTFGYNGYEKVSLNGFTDNDWNSDFDLISVQDRNNFKIRSSNSLPTLNGNEALEEITVGGVNGRYSVVVVSATELEITGSFDNGYYSSGKVKKGIRIAGTATLTRALEQYTKQNISDLWMFVTMADAIMSKNRTTYNDSYATIAQGQDMRMRIIDGFSVFLVKNVKNDISAVDAVDICRHDMLLPLTKSLFGAKFSTGLSTTSDFITVLTGHNQILYDRSTFVYEYTFEFSYDFILADTVENTDTRAFSEIDYTQSIGTEDTTDALVNFELGSEPAIVEVPLDITAPFFLYSYPKTKNVELNSFDIAVQLNEIGNVYYVVLENDPAIPTVSEVKAGTGAGGATAIVVGNINVSSANIEALANITELDSETDYNIYMVAQDDEVTPNVQAFVTSLNVTTLTEIPVDNTAPSFISTYPKVENVSATSFDIVVQLNELGTAYYSVLPNNATLPTINEVIAGTGSIVNGSIVVNTINLDMLANITGLDSETDYDIYVVCQDDEPTPNIQNTVTKIEASTLDITAPLFISTYPKVENLGGTSLDIIVQLNEIGSSYYSVLANNSTAPTVSEVKDGTGAIVNGIINVTTANTDYSASITGLTSETNYDIYLVSEDDESIPNVQASVTKIEALTTDITAPSFVATYPKTANVATKSLDIVVQLDEVGSSYYVVLGNNVTAPSVAEVIAGTGTGGSTAESSGTINVTTASTDFSSSVTGLTSETEYDIYIVSQDDEVIPNVQSLVTKVDVITTEATIISDIPSYVGLYNTLADTSITTQDTTKELPLVESKGSYFKANGFVNLNQNITLLSTDDWILEMYVDGNFNNSNFKTLFSGGLVISFYQTKITFYNTSSFNFPLNVGKIVNGDIKIEKRGNDCIISENGIIISTSTGFFTTAWTDCYINKTSAGYFGRIQYNFKATVNGVLTNQIPLLNGIYKDIVTDVVGTDVDINYIYQNNYHNVETGLVEADYSGKIECLDKKNIFDGTFDLGTIDLNSTDETLIASAIARTTNWIDVSAGLTLTISGNDSKYWQSKDLDGVVSWLADTDTVTVPLNATQVRCFYSSTGSHTTVMIEYGDTATTYEEYKKHNFTIAELQASTIGNTIFSKFTNPLIPEILVFSDEVTGTDLQLVLDDFVNA